jgi:hypothetical protein
MMGSVLVAMELIRFSTGTDDMSEITCAKCGASLDLHQLDIENPWRMLGACESCKSWYLIDAEEAVMVLLPDERELREI